jgi:hypothetical protein
MTELPETGFVLSVSTATCLAGPKLHKNTRVLVQCSDPGGKEVSLCAFEIDVALSGEPQGVTTSSFRLGEAEKLFASYVRTLHLVQAVCVRKSMEKYNLDWKDKIPREILEKSIYTREALSQDTSPIRNLDRTPNFAE